MKAASQHGVGVRQLNERSAADTAPRRRTRGAIPEASREPRDDWNQIFRLAPADIKMNDKQKQLMEIAKASRATVGVGVMETPFAPVVEYALTKDAGLSSPSRDSAKISVTLSQSTVLTINRRSVDITSRMCIWHGSVEGTKRRRRSCGGRTARWPARSSTRAVSMRSGIWAGRCMRWSS